jgi:predicted nucleic acid-binding protein
LSTFVDTSAFYALMDANDNKHEDAMSTWSCLLDEPNRMLSSNYVVVETIALLQHRLGLDAVHVFVEDMLPVVRIAWVTEADHAAALSILWGTGRRKVSFVDCTSFIVAKRLGAREVFCYDPHFEQFGFQRVRKS